MGTMEQRKYDIAVVGSGDAATTVAFTGVKKGKKVAVIDKNPSGGTCSLHGCLPEIYLLAGTETADQVRRLNDAGIRLGSGQVSWKEITAWMRACADPIAAGKE